MSSTGQPKQQTAQLARIARSEAEGIRVVEVVGELDISNIGDLEAAAFDFSNDGLGIVLDLSAASYIDSATLRLLFKLHHGLQRRGQALRVVCPPQSSAARVLELTGFSSIVACEADRRGAVAAIRRDVPLHE
ncbi:MAG TPA: STAS domain-containing protein [Solirubrobacteraceae bacterium]|nr:STAS domain-containing protein [Solirubrobacteraceae bacterium]